jgi:hypothetical protein
VAHALNVLQKSFAHGSTPPWKESQEQIIKGLGNSSIFLVDLVCLKLNCVNVNVREHEPHMRSDAQEGLGGDES